MSTTTKSKIRSTSNENSTHSVRYRDDLFGWVQQQVALLRQGSLTEIDADNIAEELSDVGGEQYDKLESSVRVVLLHLLKWDHQPERRSKSWVFSIRAQRRYIGRVIRKSPSLKPHIAEAIREAYRDARDEAEEETGLSSNVFESTCPYDWAAVLTRAVEFEGIRSPEE